jgi:hypothetical protein
MTRVAGLFSILLVVLASCDSSTDLGEVDLVGRWDAVGALQASNQTFGLALHVQSSGQSVQGSWRKGSSQGSLGLGAFSDGEVTFRLNGFSGQPTFTGRLTDKHRLEGEFDALDLEGAAVFRRGSIVP